MTLLRFICSDCGVSIDFSQDRRLGCCDHCGALNITLQMWHADTQTWCASGAPQPPRAQLEILHLLCVAWTEACESLYHAQHAAWQAIDTAEEEYHEAAKEQYHKIATAYDKATRSDIATRQLTSELQTHINTFE